MFKLISKDVVKLKSVCIILRNNLFQDKRYVSSIGVRPIPKPGQRSVDVSFETDAILSSFPKIHDEVLNEQLFYYKNDTDLRERYSKMLYHNVCLDPMYLAMPIFFLHAYRFLEKPSRLTDQNLQQGCVLGWCIKMMDASIFMDDDIADKSSVRYNRPAWYTIEGVGIDIAITDAAFVEAGANFLMLNHFSSHPQYTNIHKEVLRCYAVTNVAQSLEVKQVKLQEMEKHQDFIKSYLFTLPLLKCALYLANIDDKNVHLATEELCKDFAIYIKIDNDVNGVFSPVADMQKACTDISEGRVSWLAIEAYKRGSVIQKKLLEKHYGKSNQDSVIQVYNIYNDLRLKDVFNEFKKDYYYKIYSKICNNLPNVLPPQLFINYLDHLISGDYRE